MLAYLWSKLYSTESSPFCWGQTSVPLWLLRFCPWLCGQLFPQHDRIVYSDLVEILLCFRWFEKLKHNLLLGLWFGRIIIRYYEVTSSARNFITLRINRGFAVVWLLFRSPALWHWLCVLLTSLRLSVGGAVISPAYFTGLLCGKACCWVSHLILTMTLWPRDCLYLSILRVRKLRLGVVTPSAQGLMVDKWLSQDSNLGLQDLYIGHALTIVLNYLITWGRWRGFIKSYKYET